MYPPPVHRGPAGDQTAWPTCTLPSSPPAPHRPRDGPGEHRRRFLRTSSQPQQPPAPIGRGSEPPSPSALRRSNAAQARCRKRGSGLCLRHPARSESRLAGRPIAAHRSGSEMLAGTPRRRAAREKRRCAPPACRASGRSPSRRRRARRSVRPTPHRPRAAASVARMGSIASRVGSAGRTAPPIVTSDPSMKPPLASKPATTRAPSRRACSMPAITNGEPTRVRTTCPKPPERSSADPAVTSTATASTPR